MSRVPLRKRLRVNEEGSQSSAAGQDPLVPPNEIRSAAQHTVSTPISAAAATGSLHRYLRGNFSGHQQPDLTT